MSEQTTEKTSGGDNLNSLVRCSHCDSEFIAEPTLEPCDCTYGEWSHEWMADCPTCKRCQVVEVVK